MSCGEILSCTRQRRVPCEGRTLRDERKLEGLAAHLLWRVVRGAKELRWAGAHHGAAAWRTVILQNCRHLRELADEEAKQLHLPYLRVWWRWWG